MFYSIGSWALNLASLFDGCTKQMFTLCQNYICELVKTLILKMQNCGPQISFLSDGSLYADDGYEVKIYNQDFCMDNFVNRTLNSSVLSALVCRNITSSFSGTSPKYKPQQVKLPCFLAVVRILFKLLHLKLKNMFFIRFLCT